MAGWIKVHRDITKHWIFQDAEKFKWWMDLLIMASYEDDKLLVGDSLITLKRGQLNVSLSFLSARWRRSKETVLNFLKLLESDRMIDRKSDRKSTTITICNYEGYQDVEQVTPTANRPQADRKPTETKKSEEVKEIYNTPTARTYAREQEFIRQYREEGDWPTACMILHLKSVSEVEQLFDSFILEYQHKGQTHQDFTDFKGHFIQWARITIQKEKKSNGDNNNRTNQRRGVQVVANSPEDYQGPF